MKPAANPATSCMTCPVGKASGVGNGQFCPLIVRDHPGGEVLFRAGEQASYVWFVRSGQVELRRGAPRPPQRKGPGSFIGLEALVCDTYATTTHSVTDTRLCGATREGFMQWLGPRCQRFCVILSDVLTTEDL